jgi:sucrose-6-phosphate hydrolase SacC (GH32 family)
MIKYFKVHRFLPGAAGLLCLAASGLYGCGGSSGASHKSDVALIILEEGQTVADVIGSRSSSSSSSRNNGNIILTPDPANEGRGLFVNAEDPAQNIAGFEFCCGGYGTYPAHGFTDATGDFARLDGGFWASDIDGAVGERVFSSYGDGADDESSGKVAQVGQSATGTLTSPTFVIDSSYINFLVGGGGNRFDAANATAVVLLVDGEVVRQAHGNNESNRVAWASWDVSALAGKTAAIRFIDYHPDDHSDSALPYILADEFRAADKAAAIPAADSVINLALSPLTPAPDTSGTPLFSRLGHPDQHIAGFEFCCGGYDTYQNHGFLASGDFIHFDGGEWAADIVNSVGERVFASYGPAFADSSDNSGVFRGWEATGKLRTPAFTIEAPFINFLIGGGTHRFDSERATAVVLRVNGKIVRHAIGNGKERELSRASWDVSALIGETGVIEIIDAHDNSDDDGSLPFILVDEFRQDQRAAVAPLADSIISRAGGHDLALLLDMGDPNPFYKDGSWYIYYLQNSGFHPWYLAKTDDLLTSTFPVEVLPASGDAARQDQWIGSGSVIEDASGRFHLFYTGHNAQHAPVEAVMHAVNTDNTLTRWQPVVADTFTGSGGYSDFDFRDPLVFHNAAENRYWMLITSRYQSQAAIGLYTSTDLSVWTPSAPLYTEVSPLNLEVADYFYLDGVPFILYSDQRDNSRQVKYLQQQGSQWRKADYEALDGNAFYAARTAASARERLLFGWVAHKDGRHNAGTPVWGGDLVVHQLYKSESGALRVALPEIIRNGLAQPVSTAQVWQAGAVADNAGSIELGIESRFVLAASEQKNRLSLRVTGQDAASVFGIQLRESNGDGQAFIEVDAAHNRVMFYRNGEKNNADNPQVSVPLNVQDGINLELLLDPLAGTGVLYLNNERALSFRLYGLKSYQPGVYSTSGALSVHQLERYQQ